MITPALIGAIAGSRRRSAGGPVYLLQQDFTNGSGSTPGAPTYGGSWTNSSGTWNFSNTSPSLPNGGNNAKGGPDFGGGFCYGTFTSQTVAYGYFEFQVSALPGGTKTLMSFRNSAGTLVCRAILLASGTIGVINSSFESAATADAISAGTNYRVWWSYDTVGNTITVGWATSGTRPTSGTKYASASNSVNTAVERAGLDYSNENSSWYYDHILVNDTQIGDSP